MFPYMPRISMLCSILILQKKNCHKSFSLRRVVLRREENRNQWFLKQWMKEVSKTTRQFFTFLSFVSSACACYMTGLPHFPRFLYLLTMLISLFLFFLKSTFLFSNTSNPCSSLHVGPYLSCCRTGRSTLTQTRL